MSDVCKDCGVSVYPSGNICTDCAAHEIKQLRTENDELKERIESLNREIIASCNAQEFIKLKERLKKADDAIKLARECIEFYARVGNWISPSEGFALQYDPEKSPVNKDKGEKAAKYLLYIQKHWRKKNE